MENLSGIYEILNTVNGKRYIGSSVNMAKREQEHRSALRCARHHSIALQRAWNMHGADAFLFRQILTCAPTTDMLLFYEQQLIDKVLPEYNVAKDVRRPMFGRKHSAEAKEKNAAARRGKKMPPRSEAHRLALSAANKGKQNCLGRVNSPEVRERMRQAALRREKKPLTPAQIANLAKMAEFNRGRKREPHETAHLKGNTHAHGGLGVKKHAGHGAKVSAGLTGKKKTAEHIENHAATLRGRKHSPEHRIKQSIALRAYHDRRRAAQQADGHRL